MVKKKHIRDQLRDTTDAKNKPVDTKEAHALVRAIIKKNCPNYRPQINPVPTDIESIDKLGLELMEWVAKSDDFNIEEFPLKRGYVPYKFFKLREKSEFFADCEVWSRETIGNRMNTCWAYGKIAPNFAQSLLALYKDEYKRARIDAVNKIIEARHMQQLTAAQSQQFVVLDKYPDCEEVPQRIHLPEEEKE